MTAKSNGHQSSRFIPAPRDWLILVGVLVVVTIVYLGARRPPQPPAPAAGGATHGGMPGEEMSGTMDILNNLPQDYDALVSMGNDFMDQRNFPIAAECYKRALALDSSSNDVRVDFGACLHGMGLPERAADEFRQVLRQDPSHAVASFNLGIVYYDLDRIDSARVYWQKYLDLAPNGPAAQSAQQLLEETGG